MKLNVNAGLTVISVAADAVHAKHVPATYVMVISVPIACHTPAKSIRAIARNLGMMQTAIQSFATMNELTMFVFPNSPFKTRLLELTVQLPGRLP